MFIDEKKSKLYRLKLSPRLCHKSLNLHLRDPMFWTGQAVKAMEVMSCRTKPVHTQQ